jgi:ADP-heptose:LPS heptosyltransferase
VSTSLSSFDTEPREIGVLNLTRFGDLVQTSPILTGLRKRHPHARITLIVKSRFRAVAELLPCVDRILEVDGHALVNLLNDPETPFVSGSKTVKRLADQLAETRFDVLFNFTHSRLSGVLISLLRAERRVGFSLDRRGNRFVEEPWLNYVGTLVRNRRLVHTNLVDIYLGAAGLIGCGERLSVRISAAAREFAEAALSEAGVCRIALQLGASSDTKTWSLAHYAATLKALSAAVPGLRVTLVGVDSEKARAGELQQACPSVRFDDLVGQSSVEELAATLERCSLLLTGDTGTMHLAAAVGTPTLAVFVGLGQPYETAVYAEGHWAVHSRVACAPCAHDVRCGRPVCHDDIPTDWLADLARRILASDHPERVEALPRADLLRTRFDELGMLELVPVHERRPQPSDLMALAYKRVFLEGLCGARADGTAMWDRGERYYGVERGSWLDVLPPGFGAQLSALEQLGARGEGCAAKLAELGRDPAEMRRAGEALAALDQQIYALCRAQPLLSPLGYALEGALEFLPGADLPEVVHAASNAYRSVRRQARVLSALLAGQTPDSTPELPARPPAARTRRTN